MKISFRSNPKPKPTPFKMSYQDANITESFANYLYHFLYDVDHRQSIVFICIGTDRSTGDSLGPIVGSNMSKYNDTRLHVYGTLDHPVHALNLNETISEIHRNFPNPFVIAIDACLGHLTSVGSIQICEGPVKPGAGVNKELPPVGHIHITGVVNVGGFMEYFVLQNTRLSLVMSMANIISSSIYVAMQKLRLVQSPFVNG